MKRALPISLAAILLAAGAWLFYTCAVNPNIHFLPPGPGSWIVYPTPPQVPPLAVIPMKTAFHGQFVLPKSPATAVLSWRCFKSGQVSLNGVIVAANDPAHWKSTARLDVSSHLRVGTNELVVQVMCDNGLPALSLELAADAFLLTSDESWASSLAGALWQPAQLASQPTDAAPGNGLYGTEKLPGALQQCWPMLLAFALVAALAVLCGRIQTAALLLLAGGYALLFVHNLPLLPAMSGFDARAHMYYIDYIQRHNALPSANQGWEFFQAPLYYVLGALLLGLVHVRALQPEAGQVLGLLNLLLAAVEMVLILSALRQLFPGRRLLHIAGVLLAALLPAQMCLMHYPTNELLAAVTATAAIGCCLAMLRQEKPGIKWYAALGILLGLAMLSKVSCALAMAAIFVTLAVKAYSERQSSVFSLQPLAFSICLALCGFHYWKLWRHFGSPFTGNWNPAVTAPWWQLPGYHDPAYYLAFGRSLASPYLSGFHSFWDGLYSTLWGDGLLGGADLLYKRPPWNYNLMTAGCLLALVPSALVLTGLCRAVRQRRLDWLFLAAVATLYGAAIFCMSLKVPSYAQSKAFYGLSAILPFCSLGILGLDFWITRFHRVRPFLLVGLGVWMLTVYASFWIQPDTVQTRLSIAIGLFNVPGQDPGPALANVLALDPHNPVAIADLATLEDRGGHLSRAVARLEAAAQTATNALLDTTLAQYLGRQGRVAEALEWAGRACALSTDYPVAPALLCSLSVQAGQNEQAVRAGRMALRISPQDGEVHFNVGLALSRLNRYEEAASCLIDAVNCSPGNADARHCLGLALWHLPGKKAQARDQLAAALQLSPKNAEWKAKLEQMQRELDAH